MNSSCRLWMSLWVKVRMLLDGAVLKARCPLLGGVTWNSSPSGPVSWSSALSSSSVTSVTEPTHTWWGEGEGRKERENQKNTDKITITITVSNCLGTESVSDNEV